MAKEIISRTEHLQLLGLEVLIRKHCAMVDDLRAAVGQVLGVPAENDYLSDFVYADRQLADLLNDLGVRLEEQTEAADAPA